MKPIKVKAWPELVGFQPSLQTFRDIDQSAETGPEFIEVDFGSVRSVSSTGLAVFLLRLFRLLNGQRTPLIRQGASSEIFAELVDLRAFELLGAMSGAVQHELLLEVEPEESVTTPSTRRRSLPIYRLSMRENDNKRGLVSQFKRWLLAQLSVLTKGYDIATNGLVMMIGEIAKNSADHAASDALFGLDVDVMDAKRAKLSFVFGDLGIGIKQHIEKHLSPDEEKRRRHMSLYEAYRLALKPGYTSNYVSTVNRGHGMSIIVDCATDLQMHLSVFDASSRGLLSNLEHLAKPSHAGVRRIFHHVGHDVGFFYFGELVMTRKNKQ